MELSTLFDEMRVGELSEKINGLFPDVRLSLEEMMDMLLQGRLLELVRHLFEAAIRGTTERAENARTLLLTLLLLGITGAVVMQFSDLLERFQVAKLSFFIFYLLQAAILTRCFLWMTQSAEKALDGICYFVRLLMPTYLFAVGISTGTITAGAGQQMAFLIIYGAEVILKGSFLPLIKCFFLTAILEGMQAKEHLELLLDFMKKAILWGLKGGLAIVAGISFLQATLTPALDRLSGSVLKKMISAIPGIGNGAEGVLELTLSSAMVIKNSMGILLMLLLMLTCLSPLFELFLFSVTFKIAAALAGIISDKRMTNGLDRAGETGFLLLGVVGEGMLLFLITIAVTCTAAK